MVEIGGYKSQKAFLEGHDIVPNASSISSLRRCLAAGKDLNEWVQQYKAKNKESHNRVVTVHTFLIDGETCIGVENALIKLGFDEEETKRKIANSARVWLKNNPDKTIYDFTEHRKTKNEVDKECKKLEKQGFTRTDIRNFRNWRRRQKANEIVTAEEYMKKIKNKPCISPEKQHLSNMGLSNHEALYDSWKLKNPDKTVEDFALWFHTSYVIRFHGKSYETLREVLNDLDMTTDYDGCQKYLRRNYPNDRNAGFAAWYESHKIEK